SRAGRALELPMLNPLLQIFLHGAYHVRDEHGAQARAPAAGLWGPSQRVVTCEHDEPLSVFVIILTNSGLRSIFGRTPAQIADKRVDLADVEGGDAFAAQVRRLTDFEQRVAFVSDWLSTKLKRTPSSVIEIADRVVSGALRGPVSEIAASVGMNERTLQRAFQSELGWRPKQGLRLARLQRALGALHPTPWRTQSECDPLLEFHDQAHLTREFQALAAITPGQYRRAKAANRDRLINTIYLPAR
ncbi:MAG TPA: helix-turn-helix domain-containing protein, partial [Verrucomicrobiae bacterium]|nr:helix-turn-helix domain-containing protein [Verrucomicrobiae bacterium]